MAEESWPVWRLVFDGGMNFREVEKMEEDELYEANAALDYYIELQRKG